ncbi:MAG: ThiF family adenylyltransferase, partial [Rhodobiaceae bacterium]
VSLSNLQRQILFTDNVLGQDKAETVADALGALNPHLETHIHKQRLDNDNGAALLAPYDLVIDGSDNFATRLAVNDVCFHAQKTLISGAVGRFDGHVMTFKPWLTD